MKKMMALGAALTMGIILTLGAGLGLGAAANAGKDHGGKDRPRARLFRAQRGRAVALRGDLNLTDEQKEELKKIVKGHGEQLKPAVKAVVEKKRMLRDAMDAQPLDEKAVRWAAEELAKPMAEAAVVRARIWAEAKTKLTDRQLQLIEDFKKQGRRSAEE